MMNYDLRIETVLDSLRYKADKYDIELLIDSTFEDECAGRGTKSAIIHNIQDNKFAVIGVNVEEFPDEPICFFTFNGKLYEYCKMEGFDRRDMTTTFDNKILKKVDCKEFMDFVLNI